MSGKRIEGKGEKIMYEEEKIKVYQNPEIGNIYYDILFTDSLTGRRSITIDERIFLELTQDNGEDEIGRLERIWNVIDPNLLCWLSRGDLIRFNHALHEARKVYERDFEKFKREEGLCG